MTFAWFGEVVNVLELRQLFEVLSPTLRKRFFWVLVLTLVTAVSALVGVGSILPFMALANNPDILHQYSTSRWLFELLTPGDERAFVLVAGVATLLAVALHNGLAGLTLWAGMDFSSRANHELGVRLISSYLARPYAWLLGQSSSNLGKNLLSEVNLVVEGFVQPLIGCLVHGTTGLFLLGLLLAVDSRIALLAAAVLLGAYLVVYYSVRGAVERYGLDRATSNRARYRAANEALVGAREHKVYGCERYFIERYAETSEELAILRTRLGLVEQLPRNLMETLVFGGMIAIVAYFVAASGSVGTAIPTLSLCALCALKLIPALQQTYSSLARLRFHRPALAALHRDLVSECPPVLPESSAVEPLSFQQKIEFVGVEFRYPGSDEPVLQRLDLTIEKGARVALVGASGVGKTTLVGLLLGLLSPTSGKILVDGGELTGERLAAWRQVVGYVPQEVFLLDDTVEKNIAFGREQSDAKRLEQAAETARIAKFVKQSLADGYQTVIGERGQRLSGGQRQRLAIARALYREPSFLVLDEATNALDDSLESEFYEAVEKLSGPRTMVVIAHRVSTLRRCHRILVLDSGRLVDSGSYAELQMNSPAFRRLAGGGEGESNDSQKSLLC